MFDLVLFTRARDRAVMLRALWYKVADMMDLVALMHGIDLDIDHDFPPELARLRDRTVSIARAESAAIDSMSILLSGGYPAKFHDKTREDCLSMINRRDEEAREYCRLYMTPNPKDC